eukprot:Lithocolla_globosa_v1_NODE_3600_length_1626_cov_4.720560.p2 type:complete len:160 gc:universal NODE_3600_length_1626_cov_4.720560:1212-733(-)
MKGLSEARDTEITFVRVPMFRKREGRVRRAMTLMKAQVVHSVLYTHQTPKLNSFTPTPIAKNDKNKGKTMAIAYTKWRNISFSKRGRLHTTKKWIFAVKNKNQAAAVCIPLKRIKEVATQGKCLVPAEAVLSWSIQITPSGLKMFNQAEAWKMVTLVAI